MAYETVLLFGPPGSGKGTQGKIIGAMPGFCHFACGDVFRSLDPQSEMGRLFRKYAQNGSLVPDELTVGFWKQSISADVSAGRYNPEEQLLLLDGIPRTTDQARLMAGDLHVQCVIFLYINDVEQIVQRLRLRAAKENRADDTDIEVIRHRIDVYEEQTRPLLDLYTMNRVFRINATRPPEAVTGDILKALTLRNRPRADEW
jgi:adenylate kinase